MVRGEGWYMVRWLALAALATVPKSPLSPYCFLISDSCRPVAAAKACHAVSLHLSDKRVCTASASTTKNGLGRGPLQGPPLAQVLTNTSSVFSF